MRETAFWSTHKDKNGLQHCIQPIIQAKFNEFVFFFFFFFFSKDYSSRLFFWTSNASEFQ